MSRSHLEGGEGGVDLLSRLAKEGDLLASVVVLRGRFNGLGGLLLRLIAF
jgi:hypothetical protein